LHGDPRAAAALAIADAAVVGLGFAGAAFVRGRLLLIIDDQGGTRSTPASVTSVMVTWERSEETTDQGEDPSEPEEKGSGRSSVGVGAVEEGGGSKSPKGLSTGARRMLSYGKDW
jgi:hypothetical protein